jgi:hypothetical protein
MAKSDSNTTGTPTISVATMSAITIDLDARAALLPRQGTHGVDPLRSS